MADWKTQISYNYNPSYHAYAYGLVYQPGSEQSHGNHLAGVMDLSSYNAGMTQAYYATARAARDESPPGSPEQPAAGGHHHYPGSGVVYLGDSQSGRLLLGRPHRVAYDARENEVRRVGSDSTSDSEAHTSPEEPHAFAVAGNEEGANDTTSLHKPITAPNEQSTASNPKRKARTAFSEVQMNALVQRFSVQRYLTPAEMKNLAELTGLTYKQVKTWFQNRRMKLRRHQKDSSWVSERYSVNKDSPGHGSMYTNIPSHVPPYGGEAQSQLKEHYNQHMMETDFKKATPQNLAFYLAAMGSAAGSAGYPSWSPGPSQTAVPARPQAVGWSMPPGVGHYDYNTNTFNSPGHDTSFESKEDEHVS
ncbi:hypothetical protein F2P81_019332 [Scophthalmus maximus]|uniref:Homeobox domain-containing protein n=1 Tax=Scophthalmus maximus TaxID=52904 RepID=A0A6A4S7I5_SCOMX|nr:hypothetical protein F2P81_019332 [Scophthalmus maximus]